MALRLVRQTSETPNITNKDDTIMTRYAYGYNGVVKAFGSECGYTAENGIFKVLDGRIVIDGWEIDVDGGGWSLDLHSITGTQYHSVYAEINVAIENVKLDSTYLTGSYPEITKGDDLTEIPNGTARLLLYNVKVQYGTITEVIKRFQIIPYLADIENQTNTKISTLENQTNTKISSIEERLTNLGFKKGYLWMNNTENGDYVVVGWIAQLGKVVYGTIYGKYFDDTTPGGDNRPQFYITSRNSGQAPTKNELNFPGPLSTLHIEIHQYSDQGSAIIRFSKDTNGYLVIKEVWDTEYIAVTGSAYTTESNWCFGYSFDKNFN